MSVKTMKPTGRLFVVNVRSPAIKNNYFLNNDFLFKILYDVDYAWDLTPHNCEEKYYLRAPRAPAVYLTPMNGFYLQ